MKSKAKPKLTGWLKQSAAASTPEFEPQPYQEEGIVWLLEKSFAGLFWDPGLGKTITVLQAFKLLKREGFASKLLVFASRRIAHNVWPAEVRKWKLPFRVAVATGSLKNREEALASDHDILVVNYENIPWIMAKFKKKMTRPDYEMLVVDESSKMRNCNTKRFRALRGHLGKFSRRVILTGTPVPKGLLNLFGQMLIADGGESLGQLIGQYRLKYFEPCGYMGKEWRLCAGAEEKIYDAIAPRILRKSRKELDMPPMYPVIMKLPLDEAARKNYNTLERDLVLELKGQEITAANAAVLTGKLRQLSNGAIYVGPQMSAEGLLLTPPKKTRGVKPFLGVHDTKLEALSELVEEMQGRPLLIGYEFDYDRARIQELMNVPHVGGSTSDKEAAKLMKEWNEGKHPVLLGQISSVAWGLNLQLSGASVVFFSLTWDLEAYEQFIQRIWRQGQTEPVMVYHLIAEDTIDEVVLKTLEGKHRTQQALLDALEERYQFNMEKTTQPEEPSAATIEEPNKKKKPAAKKSVAKKAAEPEHRRRALNKILDPKGAMLAIPERFKTYKQPVPKYNPTMNDPGPSFLLNMFGSLSKLSQAQLENLHEVLTGVPHPYKDASAQLRELKSLLLDLFQVQDDSKMEVPESTWKMYGIFTHKAEESSTTDPEEEKAMTSNKKISTKKAATSKKKVVTKKVPAKKVPAKKVTSKKKAAVSKAPVKKAPVKKAPVKKEPKTKASKEGQFCPLGTRDWSKVDLEAKVVRGDEPSKKGELHEMYEFIPGGAAGLKISTLVSKVAEKLFDGDEKKAKNRIWPLLNKSYALLAK